MDQVPARPLLNNEDLCHVALWAADCAERALPVFEARAPGDSRPREAIAAARAFAGSGVRTANLRKLAWAALAAAREVGDEAAAAAARSASTAAGSAYTHPLETAHQVNHIVGPAAYSVQAISRGAADEAGTREAEIRWAIDHASPALREVVRRLSARAPGKGASSVLFHRIDAALRS
jgi:hypothetical protein